MTISRAKPPSRTERAQADATKSAGVHYTPAELASFVASNALALVSAGGRLRVLDPACGDGALLAAVAEIAPPGSDLELVGCDKDQTALEAADARLTGLRREGIRWSLELCDFLSEAATMRDASESLFGGSPQRLSLAEPFDIVIANPPYVRTQTLGADESRRLAAVFGLTGRVDLYHAFAVAMTESLRAGGVLALLCSNRFMTTKGGSSLRKHLQTRLDVNQVFDLGDTKLFGAAVLPAVVVAFRGSPSGESPLMTSVYECPVADGHFKTVSVLRAVTEGIEGHIQVGSNSFEIRRGHLNLERGTSDPWVLVTEDEGWVSQVEKRAVMRFRDLGKIRVGIKTTADKVFIQEDWGVADIAPESELLLPLLTHHVANKWKAGEPTRRVLYPYDLSERRRVPLDLGNWPKATKYLETHRAQLEGRSYVVEAGRHWWEIWVPQRPSEWVLPKLVFPDISDQPRFSLDCSGAVVNGDCYWLALPTEYDRALGLLAMAVANSSLGTRFYDQVCGNKLYSGRRRYITQYVERFPIPDPTSPEARKIVELVGTLVQGQHEGNDALQLEEELDGLVWGSFGFEEIPR